MPHATPHADAATAELDSVLRGGPFHVALRAAIAARGLPLQRVQHHLSRHGVRVGVTSLSYWQQGARRPQRPESLRAVRALEEILQLPEESLIRLLAETDDRAGDRRSVGRSYRSLVEASGVLDKLLAEFGTPRDGGLHTLGHHERVRIGARRELAQRESHHIVRAHRDGVDRYVAVHHGGPAPTRSACTSAPWRTAASAAYAGTTTPASSRPSCSSTSGCAPATPSSSGTPWRTARPASAASTCGARTPRRPVRAPGLLRHRRTPGAVPPLHPALRRCPARRPPGTAPQRAAPLGAPGGTAPAGGLRGDRLGLGVIRPKPR